MPFIPVKHRFVDVGFLCAFVAAAQKQYDTLAGVGVIHAIARPSIDTQFPYAFSAEFMIAEISQFDTGDATNDGYLGLIVTQALQPISIKVFLPMQR